MMAASAGVSRLAASARPDRYSPNWEAICTMRRTRLRTRARLLITQANGLGSIASLGPGVRGGLPDLGHGG